MKKKKSNIKRPDPYLIDDENPELTDEFFRNAVSGKEFFTKLLGRKGAEEFFKNPGGRPKKTHPKKQVTLRLDPDILNTFQAGGKGWQTDINNALRQWITEHPQG